MRVLVKYSVTLYEFALFLEAVHYFFIAVLYKTAGIVRHFFCKLAFCVHRFNCRNTTSFEYLAVVFTKGRRYVNNTCSVFCRNISGIEHSECTLFALLS